MQVDTVKAHKVVMEEDKEWYIKECCCFYCRLQNHIACNCNKKKRDQQSGLAGSSNALARSAQIEVQQEPVMNPKAIMEYLQGLDNEAFEEMRKQWEMKNGEGEGFPQA